ncbi:hypothetical protein N8144_06920, partial [Planktomarina temperata]|nr:hypothetical protein [Planktomarina temperata]
MSHFEVEFIGGDVFIAVWNGDIDLAFPSDTITALAINVNNAPVFKYSIDAFSFNLDDGIVFDASSALSFTGSENASFKFSYIYPNDAEDTSVQLETSEIDTNSWSYNGLEAGPIEPEYVFASSFSDGNIVHNGFALAFNEAVETVFPDRIAFSFDEYNMTIETQSDFDNFVNFAASTDELPIQSLEQGVSHLFSELHNIDVTHPITVSGQLTVGSVLNATVADWIDPDGTSTSTFDYQWLRNGNAVSNANNTAYELTDNDLGSTISVSVRYIDDGGTTEEITSFTSEAVGTALIRDEHSNNAGWKFYTGTDGSDLVFGQSSSVYSSGAGDDTFVSGDDAEFQAFVGGLGTDQYTITKPGVMAVAEVNDGSINILSASGIGFTYDTTFVLTVNDGQHLIVEDTLSDQAVWLIDWDEGGFSSSKAILADGEYTAQFIAENLSLRPNYLGDFSWSELIEMGVNIPNDMPELIADAKQWALGADTSNAEDVTINLNDDDGTLTAAELETWVGLTGTAPAGSELTLISTWDVTGGSEEILVTTDANGTWEITPEDVEDTPYDGTYALSLTARDASGTVLGTQTSEVTFASGNTFSNTNNLPTGSVTISGTAVVGNTLSADTSTISDEDGLGEFNYQWSNDGLEIDGATASTFLLTEAEVDFTLDVAVNYIDSAGNSESVKSLTTSHVGVAFDPELTNTFTIPVLHWDFLYDNENDVEVLKFIANASAKLELLDNPSFNYFYEVYQLDDEFYYETELYGDLSSIRITYGEEIVPLFWEVFFDGSSEVYSNLEMRRLESDDYYYDLLSLDLDDDEIGPEAGGLLIQLGTDDPDGFTSEITDQASFDEFVLSLNDLIGTAIPTDVSYGPGQDGLLNAIIQDYDGGDVTAPFLLVGDGGDAGWPALVDPSWDFTSDDEDIGLAELAAAFSSPELVLFQGYVDDPSSTIKIELKGVGDNSAFTFIYESSPEQSVLVGSPKLTDGSPLYFYSLTVQDSGLTLSDLVAGKYQETITATDPSGNSSSSFSQITITDDGDDDNGEPTSGGLAMSIMSQDGDVVTFGVFADP